MMAVIMYLKKDCGTVGMPTVGAYIKGEKIKVSPHLERLHGELPPDANMSFINNGLSIELTARNNLSLALAKKVRQTIKRCFGVVASLCPVKTSIQILRVTRAG